MKILHSLSYLKGEDLQNWIDAFASFVPDRLGRRVFISAMNINFFGEFYP